MFMTTEVICSQFVITQYIVTSFSVSASSTCRPTVNNVFVTVTASIDQFTKMHDQLLTATVSQKCHH